MHNITFEKINLKHVGLFLQNKNIEELVRLHLGVSGYEAFKSLRGYDNWTNLLSIEQECRLTRILKDKKGLPDLYVIDNNDFSFIEVKSTRDCLSMDQLRWIKSHPEVHVLVLEVEIQQDIQTQIVNLEKDYLEKFIEQEKIIKSQSIELDEYYKEVKELKRKIYILTHPSGQSEMDIFYDKFMKEKEAEKSLQQSSVDQSG
jgi:hypothetical protein